jgi:hypothetical protein
MFELLTTWTRLKSIRMDHLQRRHLLLLRVQHEPCPDAVIAFMIAMNTHHLEQSKSVYSVGLFASIRLMPNILNQDEELLLSLENELKLNNGNVCDFLKKT